MIFSLFRPGVRLFWRGAPAAGVLSPLRQADAQAAEGEMTGDDWSALGVFWISRPDRKERGLACFRRSAGMGSGWGPATWASVWNRGSEWRPTPARLSGFISRPWRWGSLSAVCNLGVCCEQGIGTTSDQKKRRWSCSWRAAEHGSSRGQRLLARCLEQGLGLPQDQKRLPWNGCGPPPFRGTPPARRSWPGTMSLASGRRSPPSRPYSGTAVRLRQGMRTDSAVWAG